MQATTIAVPPSTSKSARVPALDGIRGLAVLLVVGWHYVWWNLIEDPRTHVLAMPFATWGSGVDLFFVLSGYLLAGILLDHKKSGNYYKTFYVRRAFRILPAYWLILSPFLLAHIRGITLAGDDLPVWFYVLFVQNLATAWYSSFGHWWLGFTWSLSVEEQFYLVLPAVIRKIGAKTLRKIVCATILIAPILRGVVLFFFSGPNRDHWQGLWVLTPCRADALALGVLVALLIRNRDFLMAATPDRIYLGLIILAAANAWQLARGWDIKYLRCATFGMSLLAMFYAALLLAVVGVPDGTLARIFSSLPLTITGELSYMIYMVHEIARCSLHLLLRGTLPVGCRDHLDDLGIGALALLLTIGVALVSRRWIEQPCMRHARRFAY